MKFLGKFIESNNVFLFKASLWFISLKFALKFRLLQINSIYFEDFCHSKKTLLSSENWKGTNKIIFVVVKILDHGKKTK